MSKVNFIPTHGAILIEFPEIAPKTAGGIIKSHDMIAAEKAGDDKVDNFFPVMAVGAKEETIKIGFTAMCNLAASQMIDVDGKKYGLVPSHAILGYRAK